LLDTDNRKYKGAVFHAMSQLLDKISESQKTSKLLSIQPAFLHFGLADASIADLSNRGYLVITDDLKLQNFLQASSRFALNFTQIRTVDWLN
jgi:hypothetical protein